MSKDVQDKIFSYIDSLAEKIGVAANHMAAVLVKQVIVGAITNLITFLLVGIFIWVMYKPVKKFWYAQMKKKAEEGYASDADMGAYLVTVFYGLFILGAVIAAFICIPDDIGRFLNPDYYVVKDLVDMFKEK